LAERFSIKVDNEGNLITSKKPESPTVDQLARFFTDFNPLANIEDRRLADYLTGR